MNQLVEFFKINITNKKGWQKNENTYSAKRPVPRSKLDSKIGKHLAKPNSVIDGNHIRSMKGTPNVDKERDDAVENNLEKYSMVRKICVFRKFYLL